MACVQRCLILLLGCLAVLAVGGKVDARDIVSTSFSAPSVDLMGVLEYVQSTDDAVQVEVLDRDGNRQSTMTVTAKGRGPVHRWAIFTLHNAEPVPRDLVLASRWPGFVGSGLLWPRYQGVQLLAIQIAPGLQPQRLDPPQADAFVLNIAPGETVTYAVELVNFQPANLSLWHRGEFEEHRQQLALFRGVVLGIATLTAIFMLSLYIIRSQAAFPAAALFAFAAVGFMLIEFGYLPYVLSLFPGIPGLEPRIRAIVEVLMATGAIACLLTFVDLRKRLPIAGYIVLAALLAGVALVGYGWFMPAAASGLARILLLIVVLAGFVMIILLWRRGFQRAQTALVSWTFLLLWTLSALAAALGFMDVSVASPVLSWGLILVLLTMAFALAQFGFSQSGVNSRFLEESGRRALALAGAEQSVWDWNEEQGQLYVGPELERALTLEPGRLTRGGLKSWLSIIHPADVSSYVASVESAVQRGRGTFQKDFRLRRGDGTYRWYQLRARAIPGDGGYASRCLGTLTDITGAKRSEEHMLFDAVRDRITNLPNRALFLDRLDQAQTTADHEEIDTLYVLVIDLDRFKHVNDGLGYAVGDSLLLTMARRIGGMLSPGDTLARLSGDQFGVIVDAGKPQRNIELFANQIREAIARPIPLRPREVFLTASIGAARYRRDGVRPEELLKDADIALYEAKRQGMSGYFLFEPSMRDHRTHRLAVESDLRLSLERDEIEVVYQPIVRLATNQLAGFETLLRWRHVKHGTLEPSSFISLAEETGVIAELGSFVLNEAMRQLGGWQRAFRPQEPLFVTVSVSSRELLNRDLVDEVKMVLGREDLHPGSLKLEITEAVLMENPELSIHILQRLKQLGVSIACDQFGTGYSALSHLRRMPFDTLKIDRSFLETEDDEETAQIILETIVFLAHDLGMDVVGIGVENEEQMQFLRDLGADFGQGYYFGQPASAREVMDLLGGSQTIGRRLSRARKGIWHQITGKGDRQPGVPRWVARERAQRRTGEKPVHQKEIAAAADGPAEREHQVPYDRLATPQEPRVIPVSLRELMPDSFEEHVGRPLPPLDSEEQPGQDDMLPATAPLPQTARNAAQRLGSWMNYGGSRPPPLRPQGWNEARTTEDREVSYPPATPASNVAMEKRASMNVPTVVETRAFDERGVGAPPPPRDGIETDRLPSTADGRPVADEPEPSRDKPDVSPEVPVSASRASSEQTEAEPETGAPPIGATESVVVGDAKVAATVPDSPKAQPDGEREDDDQPGTADDPKAESTDEQAVAVAAEAVDIADESRTEMEKGQAPKEPPDISDGAIESMDVKEVPSPESDAPLPDVDGETSPPAPAPDEPASVERTSAGAPEACPADSGKTEGEDASSKAAGQSAEDRADHRRPSPPDAEPPNASNSDPAALQAGKQAPRPKVLRKRVKPLRKVIKRPQRPGLS